jgi:hypothetical protein
LAIWGPVLFTNGYVLLGDMVFTPAMHPPASLLGPVTGTVNVTLLYSLAWAISRLTGAVLLQKLMLFLLAFLPGYLMYRNAPCRGRWARLFAGTVYLVNPYVYTRMLLGQWGLLLGYALLPVAVASTTKTVREPSAGRCARTALWLAGISILSLHMGAIALVACAVAAAFELASRRPARRAALALGVVLLLFLLVSSFWLLPALRGSDTTGAIGRADLEVFKTRSTSAAGTWLSVVGMYGYWKAAMLDSMLPRNYVPLWPLFALGLLVMLLYGFASFRKEPTRGPMARAMLVLGVAGFFLALGAAAPLSGPLFSFAYDHLALFRLFREPQKFAALLALAYAVLGGLAVERLTARSRAEARPARSWRSWLVPVLLLLAVVFYSFRIFGGLWGEARAVSYPSSWEQARELLEGDSGDWRALYLPPYWYMRFDFTASRLTVTSPMPFYFTNRYVQLNALQVGPVQIDRQNVDAYVQAALESARNNGNLGAMLAPLNVKYVLMPLNDASTSYRFVEEQGDLMVVRRWKDLVLLENRVPAGHFVLAGDVGSWRSWAQLGEQARGGNLLGSFLPRGDQTTIPGARGEPLPHVDSRGSASLRALLPAGLPGRPTALFSEPYDTGWRLDGRPPRSQAGVVCAFALEGAGGSRIKITYRDTCLVAGYIVTAGGLLLCVLLLVSGGLSSARGKEDE